MNKLLPYLSVLYIIFYSCADYEEVIDINSIYYNSLMLNDSIFNTEVTDQELLVNDIDDYKLEDKTKTIIKKPIEAKGYVVVNNSISHFSQLNSTKVVNKKEKIFTISNEAGNESSLVPLNNNARIKENEVKDINTLIYNYKKIKTIQIENVRVDEENLHNKNKNYTSYTSTKTISNDTLSDEHTLVATENKKAINLNSPQSNSKDNNNKLNSILVKQTSIIDSISKEKSKIPINNQNQTNAKNTNEIITQINSNSGNYRTREAINQGFKIKILNNKLFTTNKKHTILVELENTNPTTENVILDVNLPKDWSLISVSNLKPFKANQKRNAIISFYIPTNSSPGEIDGTLLIKNKKYNEPQNFVIPFKIAHNYEIELINVSIPQNVQAGETIEATYAVKNKGNATQKIKLTSKNSIGGNTSYTLAPDSTAIVHIFQKTSNKIFTLRNSSLNLKVYSETSGEYVNEFNSFKVFPVKIKQEDSYFRFPFKTGIFYNSFTSRNEHFSTISAEITGNGYLDMNKNHNLNFIFRGPKQQNLKRFAVTDQYSLIYSYKNKTTLYLGDHSYLINRLGINGKYGMGFRLDQHIKNWTLTTFYNKPRLYDYNSEALYGVKAEFHKNENLSTGVSLVKSRRDDNYLNSLNISNYSDKGQIMTLNLDFIKRSTQFKAEVSGSVTNKHIDYANYFNLVQKIRNFNYSGNFTVAGKNYFGTLNNSIQFSNNLNYIFKKWNFTIGQGLYKVNQDLNPLFYAAEPYFENYFASSGYRFNNHHSINVRVDKRIREDQLEPRNYHYKEYGMNYGYKYSDDLLTINFNGRLGKTQNLLTNSKVIRDTYSHNISLSYKFLRTLKLQGSLNHNYSNRYGNSNSNLNYVRYNVGFNYRLNKNLRFSSNYNSGFSPEDSYLKRDYINANFSATINRNHQFQLRANYFENPGVINNKELFTYAKYTYSFGAPLKKILKQGGLIGRVVSMDPSINIKGIKIIGTGKTVMTDSNGGFELNNLPLGKNYILVEESSLQKGVITTAKIPYEVNIIENKKTDLEILLVKSSSVSGRLKYDSTKKINLEGYIKLHNDDFTYYSKSNQQGEFSFNQIVPGNYTITLLRFKEPNKDIVLDRNISVQLKSDEVYKADIELRSKERNIEFKSKNFKVGKK